MFQSLPNGLTIVARVIAFFYCIMVHEVAHGWVALKNGDPTAKMSGRLTFNPLHHIDPLGMLSLIFLRVGWAKPVPINMRNFRNPRLGLFTVSIAGVTANFLSALLAYFLIFVFNIHGGFFFLLLAEIAFDSLSFFTFNLMPLPPLDGSKVVMSFLPTRAAAGFASIERYTRFFILLFVFSGLYGKIVFPITIRLNQWMVGLFF